MSLQKCEKTTWREIGRTETLWDNLNPRFASRFVLSLAETETMKGAVKLDFYDRDKKNTENLARHDYIGHACFTVPEVSSDPEPIEFFLRNARVFQQTTGSTRAHYYWRCPHRFCGRRTAR